MRRVGITQRVEVVPSYGERRDCLDQRWTLLAARLGLRLVPLPNVHSDSDLDPIADYGLNAVLLSGGNSLTALEPSASDAAPERDTFESTLIESAQRHGVPLVGVCRGMQMLNVFFGGTLLQVEGHVATRHSLEIAPAYRELIRHSVNSFHSYAIPARGLAPVFEPIAFDASGHVEACVHENDRIAGMMWHPERESPIRDEDVALLEKFLQKIR